MVISKDFPYLEGHFPGYPVVPGVAILDMSVELIRAHLGESSLQLHEIKSAKFLAPISPGAEITIEGAAMHEASADRQWNVEWTLISKDTSIAPQKVAKLVLKVY